MAASDWQHTIAGPAVMAGVGLHTGAPVRMAFLPAGPDAGVTFLRKDLSGDNRIAARAANVADARRGTTLRNEAGAEVATVEHVMAALAGLGVDNVTVELDGPEPPAADGSAAPFTGLLRRAGLRRQGAPRRTLKILREVSVEHEGRRAALTPAESASLDVTIDFEEPIGRQRLVFDAAEADFEGELADSRTFGFLREAEALRAASRAGGASLENTVVIDGGRVTNAGGLRRPDEFVRHKVLDAIGDLALAGAPIRGRYTALRPGHALNVALLDALLADRSAWRWEAPASAAAPQAG